MAADRLLEAMMKKAIRLARRGEGKTSPNPLVGAVIFKDDRVIATGYHHHAGGPHAEIHALRRAGTRARGASMAVNLEPCCHTGRTGPCTEAIIDAGIREVIYAMNDPFEKVRGKGGRRLRDRGVATVTGVCRREAERLNEVYLTYVTTGRPFVVLKTAQSLDGRIATRSGDSRWITSAEARKFAHRLRARYDAVAVGSGTVKTDNPRLTVRHVPGENPYRLIVTASGELSPRLHIFADNSDGRTIVATTRQVAAGGRFNGIETWALPKAGGGIDLGRFLERAAREEITSVFVEGGVRLATALLKRNLIDKVYCIIAPLIIGDGIDSIGDLGVARLKNAVRFTDSGFRRLGDDLMFWGYPEK